MDILMKYRNGGQMSDKSFTPKNYQINTSADLSPVTMTTVDNSLHYTSVNHAYHLIGAINQLRHSSELCDITLNCGNRKIPAHKLILSVSSPYFKTLMSLKPQIVNNVTEIHLNGLDSEGVSQIIEFFYTSAISVTEENVWSLLPAASLLQAEEIQNLCCDFLSSQLQAENCLRIHKIATRCLCSALLSETTDFIKANFEKVLEEEVFLELTIDDLISHLKRMNEVVLSDEQILQAVKCWLIHSIDDRQSQGLRIINEFPKLEEKLQDFIPLDQIKEAKPEIPVSKKDSQSVLIHVEKSSSDDIICHNSICHVNIEISDSTETLVPRIVSVFSCRQSVGQRLCKQEPIDVKSENDNISSAQISKVDQTFQDTSMEIEGHPSDYMGEGNSSKCIDNIHQEEIISNQSWIQAPTSESRSYYEGQIENVTKSILEVNNDGLHDDIPCEDDLGSLDHVLSNDNRRRRSNRGHSDRGTEYACVRPGCAKSFFSKTGLKFHLNKHSNTFPFNCRECGKGFNRNEEYDDHMNTHTGNYWKCSVCGACPKTYHGRKVHEAQHKKPDLSCDICGKMFACRDYLNAHKKAHTNEFKCEVCQKVFHRKHHYKEHVQVHEKNGFHCIMCGFVTNYRQSLNRHIRSSHNKTREMSCCHCQQVFCRRDLLTKHEKNCTSGQSSSFESPK